jgi:hypothetical protein
MCARHLSLEGLSAIGVHEIYGAAAKAAAGHARPINATSRRSEIDKEIEFTATYFVIVAQAGMGPVKQVAETVGIFRLYRLNGGEHPLTFGYDVPATAINPVRERGLVFF